MTINGKVTDQFWNIITEINQAITVQSQTTAYKMQHYLAVPSKSKPELQMFLSLLRLPGIRKHNFLK